MYYNEDSRFEMFEVVVYGRKEPGPGNNLDHAPCKLIYPKNKYGFTVCLSVAVRLPADFHGMLKSSQISPNDKAELLQVVTDRGIQGAIEWKKTEWLEAVPKYMETKAKELGWMPEQKSFYQADLIGKLEKAAEKVLQFSDSIIYGLHALEEKTLKEAKTEALKSQSRELIKAAKVESALLLRMDTQREKFSDPATFTQQVAIVKQEEAKILVLMTDLSPEFRTQLQARQVLNGKDFAEATEKHLAQNKPELALLQEAREAHAEMLVSERLHSERCLIQAENYHRIATLMEQVKVFQQNGQSTTEMRVEQAKIGYHELMHDGLSEALSERCQQAQKDFEQCQQKLNLPKPIDVHYDAEGEAQRQRKIEGFRF
jgi:hypothetical protein